MTQLDTRPNTSAFSSRGLDAFKNVAMGNRVDTKFLLNYQHLVSSLRSLKSFYWILEVDSSRTHHYRTLYYDTKKHDLYHRHHSGVRSTYKVRSREYADSNRFFLEIKKKKIGSSRSMKKRIETPRVITSIDLNSLEEEFVKNNTPVEPQELRPALWVKFDRIALLNKRSRERVTIDINLTYRYGDKKDNLKGIAIAELKQEAIDRHSPFFSHMRSLRLRPHGFSKYSVGASLLNSHLKKNRVKPKIYMIEKILKKPKGNVVYE